MSSGMRSQMGMGMHALFGLKMRARMRAERRARPRRECTRGNTWGSARACALGRSRGYVLVPHYYVLVSVFFINLLTRYARDLHTGFRAPSLAS